MEQKLVSDIRASFVGAQRSETSGAAKNPTPAAQGARLAGGRGRVAKQLRDSRAHGGNFAGEERGIKDLRSPARRDPNPRPHGGQRYALLPPSSLHQGIVSARSSAGWFGQKRAELRGLNCRAQSASYATPGQLLPSPGRPSALCLSLPLPFSPPFPEKQGCTRGPASSGITPIGRSLGPLDSAGLPTHLETR